MLGRVGGVVRQGAGLSWRRAGAGPGADMVAGAGALRRLVVHRPLIGVSRVANVPSSSTVTATTRCQVRLAHSDSKVQVARLAAALDGDAGMTADLVSALSHNTKLRIANSILDEEAPGGRSYSEYLSQRHRTHVMLREISISMGTDVKDDIDVDRDGKVSSQELNDWLQNLTKVRGGGRAAAAEAEPSRTQLWQLMLLSGIPFIGFGFIDNCLMLVFGDVIDHTFGRVLGISTLAAAGLGNLISDVAGLGLGGYIEASAKRLGLKNPHLTLQQMQSRNVRVLIFVSTSLGVSVGCLLGMVPLLFMT